jgi:hypothetical protein
MWFEARVTNSHKQAANRPNELLKGHRARVAKDKKQINNQYQPPFKISSSNPNA